MVRGCHAGHGGLTADCGLTAGDVKPVFEPRLALSRGSKSKYKKIKVRELPCVVIVGEGEGSVDEGGEEGVGGWTGSGRSVAATPWESRCLLSTSSQPPIHAHTMGYRHAIVLSTTSFFLGQYMGRRNQLMASLNCTSFHRCLVYNFQCGLSTIVWTAHSGSRSDEPPVLYYFL